MIFESDWWSPGRCKHYFPMLLLGESLMVGIIIHGEATELIIQIQDNITGSGETNVDDSLLLVS